MNDDLVSKKFAYFTSQKAHQTSGKNGVVDRSPAVLACDIFSETQNFLATDGCTVRSLSDFLLRQQDTIVHNQGECTFSYCEVFINSSLLCLPKSSRCKISLHELEGETLSKIFFIELSLLISLVADQCQLTTSVKEASTASNEVSNPKVTDYFTLNKVQQLESWPKQKVLSCEINTVMLFTCCFTEKSRKWKKSLRGRKKEGSAAAEQEIQDVFRDWWRRRREVCSIGLVNVFIALQVIWQWDCLL